MSNTTLAKRTTFLALHTNRHTHKHADARTTTSQALTRDTFARRQEAHPHSQARVPQTHKTGGRTATTVMCVTRTPPSRGATLSDTADAYAPRPTELLKATPRPPCANAPPKALTQIAAQRVTMLFLPHWRFSVACPNSRRHGSFPSGVRRPGFKPSTTRSSSRRRTSSCVATGTIH
jgi:hypothetical protein